MIGRSTAIAERLMPPRGSVRTLRRAVAATLVALVALVGTGGWVRLSDSGLGCTTWPRCFADDFVARGTYHSLVEFINRCVIIAVGGLVVATFALAVWHRPRRTDLVWCAAGLAVGYVAEAVLGGLSVLRGLAPVVVAVHMAVALVLVAITVILYHRAAARAPYPVTPGGPQVRLGRLMLAVLGIAIIVGTVVTGSGPHAGQPGTPRLPLPRPAVTELHAVIGIFLLGLIVSGYFFLRAGHVPDGARRGYRWIVTLMLAQTGVGYLQYFTGLPADLVELHMLGAAVLVALLVHTYLALTTA
ncbi:cytochrome c oxidase assembly protein subunit 15 [Amycolatopsis echigonensis]|uniref:Heme A synthase n=2 Tax=Amycolatopsis TaxID=1813 RepID=A0A5C4M219_9PSEU|nr:COX15/CtaA family protein [Amycolatopsis niigatensis]PKV99896.1 cytochrome c oxidase assembly protein subunit 15 [Amycolatopsis niigatensis]TNC23797.1 heme A synthase [Amycolatopsis alkalitolerans]